MNILRALLVVSLLAFGPISVWGADPEFAGVLTSGGKTVLALRDDTSKPSTWHQIGERFGKYLVSSYDPVIDAVTLTHDGGRAVVYLKGARVDPQPTVALVEQLAREGDGELQKLLPDLKLLENRRVKTAVELDDLLRRSVSDPNAAQRAEETRRRLKIEEDSVSFFLSRVVRSGRK